MGRKERVFSFCVCPKPKENMVLSLQERKHTQFLNCKKWFPSYDQKTALEIKQRTNWGRGGRRRGGGEEGGGTMSAPFASSLPVEVLLRVTDIE